MVCGTFRFTDFVGTRWTEMINRTVRVGRSGRLPRDLERTRETPKIYRVYGMRSLYSENIF